MKSTKKLLSAILTISTCFSLFACGGQKVEQTPTDKPSILVEYYLSGLGEEYMIKIRDAFNERAKAGEYDFYVRIYGDEQVSTSLKQTLEANAQAGLPDVAYINSFYPNRYMMAGADWFADLSDVYKMKVTVDGVEKQIKDVINPNIVSKIAVGDKYYSIASTNGAMGFVYNKALFAKYDLEIPKTMTEMTELFKKIEKLDVNRDTTTFGDLNKNNDCYAIIYPSGAIGYWEMVNNTFAAQYLGEQGFYDFIDCKFIDSQNIDGSIDAMESIYEDIFKNQQKFNAAENPYALKTATSQTNALLQFSYGTTFMTPCGDWAYTELKSVDAEFAKDMGMFPVPLACDEEGLVNVKATPSSKVFEGVDLSDDAAMAEAESHYTKIEKAKVNPSVIPQEDQNADYIYFQNYLYSTGGATDWVIPAKSTKIKYAKQFLAYLFTSEAQNLMMKYTATPTYDTLFDVNPDFYDGLPNFVKDVNELSKKNNVLTGGRFETKAATYALRTPWDGLPNDWRLEILKSKDYTYAETLADNVVARLKYSSTTIDEQVALYEQAFKEKN